MGWCPRAGRSVCPRPRPLLDPAAMSTRVYLHTLGCPKNRVDSEVMLGTLTEAGYRLDAGPGPGRGHRGQHLRLHRERQGGVDRGHLRAGRAEADRALQEAGGHRLPGRSATPRSWPRELPEVDHFLGTGAYARSPTWWPTRRRRGWWSPTRTTSTRREPRDQLDGGATAYLKISEGCDNACAFCIIPRLRGAQRSPHHRRPGRRGGAAGQPGHGGAVAGGAGPDGLRPGPARQGPPRRPAPRALRGGRDPLAPAALRLPARLPRRADRGDRPRAEDREVPRHAAAALQRPAAALHEARPRLGLPRGPAGQAARRDPRPGAAHLADRRPARRDRADFEDLLGFVEEQRFERLGVFEYSSEDGTPAAEMAGQVPPK